MYPQYIIAYLSIHLCHGIVTSFRAYNLHDLRYYCLTRCHLTQLTHSAHISCLKQSQDTHLKLQAKTSVLVDESSIDYYDVDSSYSDIAVSDQSQSQQSFNMTNINETIPFLDEIDYEESVLNKFLKRYEIPEQFERDEFLERRTLTCLDFQIVLDNLINCTTTVLGALMATKRDTHTITDVNTNYQMVDEISAQLGMVPIRSSMNILQLLNSIENNGIPPEKEDLSYFADTLQQIIDLKAFLLDSNNKLDLFFDLANEINLPNALTELFENAFDDDNNLNASKFTELGRLLNNRERLKIRIMQTLQSLMKSDQMKDKLTDV